MSGDPFDLQRFVDAQDRDGAFDRGLAELRHGRKQSHWIWFVFPQISGLGSSETARFYAISSLDEANSYIAHPVLGPRLDTCTEALLELPTRNADAVFGRLDAMKLRSSMTLFAHVEQAAPVFRRVLDEFYAGVADQATEQRLGGPPVS
ncbi:MAG TPA: DUF1810 domain-containing protein [Solirubrobacteraceae bacterium]|jgi:uncharacterized protein (DUF1810 family)|nr:DUF1810 domain-containing protein [Solirubrobacteraceae bacterium]